MVRGFDGKQSGHSEVVTCGPSDHEGGKGGRELTGHAIHASIIPPSPSFTCGPRDHSCQVAIARFSDCMCLALWASGLWLRYTTLQNLPSGNLARDRLPGRLDLPAACLAGKEKKLSLCRPPSLPSSRPHKGTWSQSTITFEGR